MIHTLLATYFPEVVSGLLVLQLLVMLGRTR